MTNECRCGRPTRDEAYVCDDCADSLAKSLGDTWSRFWVKIEKTDTCWLWVAAKNGHGYGNFRGRPAHRIAYEWLIGPIEVGLQLDHLCRVRNCVNPAHLEPVTCKENLLRGEGSTAKRAQQTHCTRGHEFTPENTNIKINGCRECRACQSERSSKRWQLLKAANKANRENAA